jgi:type VI secretion system protein ImpL
MGDYYPFNPQGRDASIADVKRFFQPSDGILWTYVENELIPFLKRNSWNTNTWEGYGVKLSSKAVKALEVSDRIKRVLFANGFPVKFSLKPLLPVNLSGKVPSIEQVFMKIDGVENYYQMGMQRYEEFQWPGMNGSNGAQLKIIMRDKLSQPKPENFQGEWGWLKLLERAKIVPERGTRKDFNLYWFFGDKKDFIVRINYKLRAQSEDNPFIHLTKLFKVSFPRQLN